MKNKFNLYIISKVAPLNECTPAGVCSSTFTKKLVDCLRPRSVLLVDFLFCRLCPLSGFYILNTNKNEE